MKGHAESARACVFSRHSKARRDRVIQIHHVFDGVSGRTTLHQRCHAAKERCELANRVLDVLRHRCRPGRRHHPKRAVGDSVFIIDHAPITRRTVSRLRGVLSSRVGLAILYSIGIVLRFQRRKLPRGCSCLVGRAHRLLGPGSVRGDSIYFGDSGTGKLAVKLQRKDDRL